MAALLLLALPAAGFAAGKAAAPQTAPLAAPATAQLVADKGDKAEKSEKTEKSGVSEKSDEADDAKGDAGAAAGKAESGKPGVLPSSQAIGKFGDWDAAFFDDKGHKVCYMATSPVSTDSSAPLHGRDKNVMLFITHWPADSEKNAVTISAGYAFKLGSKAIVTIGSETYTMETGGKGTGADSDMSWIKEDAQDDALTTAIQKGDKLTVKGTSTRGTVITDTYSLKGSGDAYKAITKACGY
jgi:hypothetical protein